MINTKQLLLLALLGAANASAQDFFAAVQTSDTERPNLQSPWSHRAWLQLKTGYGWHTPSLPASRQQSDLTRTETHLFAELGWRQGPWRAQIGGSLVQDWLPQLRDAGIWQGYPFTGEQLRDRRLRLEMADTFVSWQQGDWWLKAGYQTLAWGEAESLKITDVLARRDQRWPGQEDLEKLRLPVGSVRITWANKLDLVTLIEPEPDRLPAAYDEFDPYIALRTGNPAQDPVLIKKRDNRPGLALRYRQHWQGVDSQLLIADVASYELAPTAADFTTQPAEVQLQSWRTQVAGLGLQAVYGNFLLRTEQAWHHHSKVAAQDPLAPWQKTDQWRGMLGGDYSGIDDLQLSAEFSWQYIANQQSGLAADRWQPGASGRATYTLLNERLTLEAFALRMTGNQGDVVRLSADWQINDAVSLGITAVEYRGSNPSQQIYPYRHNDAVLINLRWGL
ncbi:DUF1302 family protein [Gilvimarinus sp. DA14]|uniref:DUF1302 family protein n=1 Tax=Gilvimarinus sp. DA14 TaxID=2956798 RepID=UPI0020B79A98|nr:DUF1302 family protein [Gilvimarinus sp. DA14]UTF60163.1 hypothetical protein NHM04_17075 [Gilvimarinus sp. DA14]